jgi:hypothetical protein
MANDLCLKITRAAATVNYSQRKWDKSFMSC